MTDPWDERTEAIPGKHKDGSIEIDLDRELGGLADNEPATMTFLESPLLLVFEPTPVGVGEALARFGFNVRIESTAVDIMSRVAQGAPAAVLCAPTSEADRRRMLAAALKLRFPRVPILYVSTHARQEEAVLGAIREGARAVIAWPLPSEADLRRSLAPYLATNGASSPLASAVGSPVIAANEPASKSEIDTAPVPRVPGPVNKSDLTDEVPTAPTVRAVRGTGPASDAENSFENLRTAVLPNVSHLPRAPEPVSTPAAPTTEMRRQRLVQDLPSDALQPLPLPVPLPVPTPVMSLLDGGSPMEPTTEPNLRKEVEFARDMRELLDALSPFLWSLEDAYHWTTAQGSRGTADAETHARTLKTMLRIFDQLRDRVARDAGAK